MKKLNRLLVAYRSNSLFDTYVPLMLVHVPSSIKVEKIVYPANTNEEEICDDLSSRLRGIADDKKTNKPFFFLSDRTCANASVPFSYSLFDVIETLRRDDKIDVLANLDYVFSKETEKIMTAGTHQKAVKRLARLLAFPAKQPSSIFLIKEKLADHTEGKGSGGGWSGDAVMEKKYLTYLISIFAEIWPSSKIRTVNVFGNLLDERKNLDNPDVLIVIDRHEYGVHGSEDVEWPYQAKLFVLPLASEVAYLNNVGLVQATFNHAALYSYLGIDRRTKSLSRKHAR